VRTGDVTGVFICKLFGKIRAVSSFGCVADIGKLFMLYPARAHTLGGFIGVESALLRSGKPPPCRVKRGSIFAVGQISAGAAGALKRVALCAQSGDLALARMEHIKTVQGLKPAVCRQPVLVRIQRTAHLGGKSAAFFSLCACLAYIFCRLLGARKTCGQLVAAALEDIKLSVLHTLISERAARICEARRRVFDIERCVGREKHIFDGGADARAVKTADVELTDAGGAVKNVLRHTEKDLARRLPLVHLGPGCKIYYAHTVNAVVARTVEHGAALDAVFAAVIFHRHAAVGGRALPAKRAVALGDTVAAAGRQTVKNEPYKPDERAFARLVCALNEVDAGSEIGRKALERSEFADRYVLYYQFEPPSSRIDLPSSARSPMRSASAAMRRSSALPSRIFGSSVR